MRVENNPHSPAFKKIYGGNTTKQTEKAMQDIVKALKTPIDGFNIDKKISPAHWAKKQGWDLFLRSEKNTNGVQVSLSLPRKINRKTKKVEEVYIHNPVGIYSKANQFKTEDLKKAVSEENEKIKNRYWACLMGFTYLTFAIGAMWLTGRKPDNNQIKNSEKVVKTVVDTVKNNEGIVENITDTVKTVKKLPKDTIHLFK